MTNALKPLPVSPAALWARLTGVSAEDLDGRLWEFITTMAFHNKQQQERIDSLERKVRELEGDVYRTRAAVRRGGFM